MKYQLSATSDHLVAQLSGRETAEEMREFLHAVIEENRIYRRSSIFLDIRSSRALFHTGRLGLFDFFKELAGGPSCKIALLGDSQDLCISHEYVALLAQQQGLHVRSFRDRAEVFEWLDERPGQLEVQSGQQRRAGSEDHRPAP